MDKSKTYIKMCEKAEEVQDGWLPIAGDFLKLRGVDYVDIASDKYAGVRVPGDIWLPRQDQLQEMLGIVEVDDEPFLKSSAHKLLFMFYNFCIDEIGYSTGSVIDETPATRRFTSMEQLWLAFVQKEKYGKIWNGEDWAKEE